MKDLIVMYPTHMGYRFFPDCGIYSRLILSKLSPAAKRSQDYGARVSSISESSWLDKNRFGKAESFIVAVGLHTNLKNELHRGSGSIWAVAAVIKPTVKPSDEDVNKKKDECISALRTAVTIGVQDCPDFNENFDKYVTSELSMEEIASVLDGLSKKHLSAGSRVKNVGASIRKAVGRINLWALPFFPSVPGPSDGEVARVEPTEVDPLAGMKDNANSALSFVPSVPGPSDGEVARVEPIEVDPLAGMKDNASSALSFIPSVPGPSDGEVARVEPTEVDPLAGMKDNANSFTREDRTVPSSKSTERSDLVVPSQEPSSPSASIAAETKDTLEITIASPSKPLRWRGSDYRILEAGIKNDEAFVRLNPSCPEVEAKLIQQIQSHSRLDLCDDLDFICFRADSTPEE